MSTVQDYLQSHRSAIICNLKGKPEFNGALVRIVQFVQKKQRYQVLCKHEDQSGSGKQTEINILVKKDNLIFVKNIHDIIAAKNVTLAKLPWLSKATKSKCNNKNDDDEKDQNIKLENSDTVLIQNLKSATQYNDIFGKIIKYNKKSERYNVEFEFEAKTVRKLLKKCNLKFVFPNKYTNNLPIQCVSCNKFISSSQKILTCHGCASLNYCSEKCRNDHNFTTGHHGQSCFIYRENILYDANENFNYILQKNQNTNYIGQASLNETASYKKYLESNKKTNMSTKINNWKDWMNHFGFNYNESLFYSYPMTLYYIVKKYLLKVVNKFNKFNNKKEINIHLIGCRDSEFAGIESLEVADMTDMFSMNPLMQTFKEMTKLIDQINIKCPLNKDFIDSWKYRWKLMSQLLYPLQINITCYGNELNKNCTDVLAQNLSMIMKNELYIPSKIKKSKYPDIIIGLQAGIHEYKDMWLPVINHCAKNKIPMIFTEGCMVEYELYIRHLFATIGIPDNNMIVAFNPFRDIQIKISPFMRRIMASNKFIYGVIKY